MPPRPAALRPVDRVVVPVQGTDREFMAQQWAVELAAGLGVPVHAVHVTDAREGRAPPDVFEFLRRLCEKWNAPLTTRVAHRDDVVNEIVEDLGPRDLCVIGTRHMSGQYHVGSVAIELVKRAPCPVQIVRIE
jgi:nucleotide-binding universal stress UspA family protein